MTPDAGNHLVSANEHPECYGSMFPTVLTLGQDWASSGTVFSVELERAGGIWRSIHSVTADLTRWEVALSATASETATAS